MHFVPFPYSNENVMKVKSESLPTRAPISVYKTLSVFFNVDSVSKQGPLVGDDRDVLGLPLLTVLSEDTEDRV